MILLLLFLIFFKYAYSADPCAACPLPSILQGSEGSLCDTKIPVENTQTLIRASDGDTCYLILAGITYHDLILADNSCDGVPNTLRKLPCVDGTFRSPNGGAIRLARY